ncbi:hypothetical protein ACLOAU_06635 [Niabella sp. CJ426]|uniref:hypothetical protein n=1 Tax=Niabella sp. CJ426 TaxID=3393740 RepID=UPI003CFFC62B
MLNFFGKKNEERENIIPGEWAEQTTQMKERWFSFLQKLEDRMEELCSASVTELKAMREQSGDLFDRDLHQVQTGIVGQLSQMEGKIRDVYEQQVYPFYKQLLTQLYDAKLPGAMAYDFREACNERQNQFEAMRDKWRKQLDEAVKPDNEAAYRRILEEHEQVKGKFKCQQCGAGIKIEKIYFTPTYLQCSACSTQNTFQPSSLTQSLPHLARSLAEERTAYLLDEYNINPRPELYRHYLRTMFDEWNSIVPDMAHSNEKFYQRLLADFNNTIA